MQLQEQSEPISQIRSKQMLSTLGADGPDTAKFEISFFFNPKEIFPVGLNIFQACSSQWARFILHMLLLLDNFDSFTYHLVQAFEGLGIKVKSPSSTFCGGSS